MNGSVPEQCLPCVVIDVAIPVQLIGMTSHPPNPIYIWSVGKGLLDMAGSADLSGVLTPLRIMSPADAPVERETFEELQ